MVRIETSACRVKLVTVRRKRMMMEQVGRWWVTDQGIQETSWRR